MRRRAPAVRAEVPSRHTVEPSHQRVIVEHVRPEIDGGRFPIKRTPGEPVVVTADIFADGHDLLAGVLKYRIAGREAEWTEVELSPLDNDAWTASFIVQEVGRYEYTVEAWIDRFEATEDPIRHGMATVMLSFVAGLFVGEEGYEAIKDNLDLERWFRLPKSHERRIHGHRHAGIRLVLDGTTLVPALDAHAAHPGPFTADDLLAYRAAREPPCQTEARSRRTIMRKARSKRSRPLLLAELERRYLEMPEF